LPDGYVRYSCEKNSFLYHLQNIPLKPLGTNVYYFEGMQKFNQDYHVAVIDLDVGDRDLQQCIDAVIQLKVGVLFQQKHYSEIAFNFVSDGKPRYF
jgi:hypothetical protein